MPRAPVHSCRVCHLPRVWTLLAQLSEEVRFNPGDVVAVANGPVTNRVFLVKSGELVLVPADVPLPGARRRTERAPLERQAAAAAAHTRGF